MENTKFLKIVIVVLLIVNIGTLAFLWIQRPLLPPHHPPHGDTFSFLTNELNLTVQQQQQFEELRREHHHAMENIQNQSRDLHHRFFDLLPSSDLSSVQRLADSMAANQKQIEMLTFSHFQKVRALCNTGQQRKFDEVIEEALQMMSPKPPPGRER